MKYPPLFKRVPVDRETTGKVIVKVQEQFEKFWYDLNKTCDRNAEKTLAMRHMQEACMWFCRALAVADFKPDEPAPATDALDAARYLNPPPLNPVLCDKLTSITHKKRKIIQEPQQVASKE